MKYYIFLIIAFAFSINIQAESKSTIAVLVDETALENQFEALFIDRLFDYLNQSERTHYQRYHYHSKDKKVSIQTAQEEQISEKAIIIEPEFKNSTTPKINVNKDTLGKIVSVTMDLNLDFTCYFKQIDIATSQIEFAKKVKMDSTMESMKADLIYVDLEKYFIGNVPKAGSKEYTALEAKIHADYKDQITTHYTNRINKDYSMLSDIASAINAQTDTHPFGIAEIPDKKGKKMSSFIIKAGKNVDLSNYQPINIYKQLNIAGESTVELIGTAILTDVKEIESTARFVFSGGKALSEAYQSGEEVFAVRNPSLLNDKVSKREQEFKVSFKSTCLFCNYELQNQLSSLYFIKLIENTDDFILPYFKGKLESKLASESQDEKLTKKSVDVDFILQASPKNISITDLAKGEQKSFDINEVKNDYRMVYLEVFPPKIEMLEVAKQKKDRIKNIYLYSPYGLVQTEYIYIYKVYYEEEYGVKHRRTKELGNGQVRSNYSDLIADVALQRNEKNVSKAINDEVEILYTYTKLKIED